jgi:hypothetical protein
MSWFFTKFNKDQVDKSLGKGIKKKEKSWALWFTPVISALRRLRHEDYEFKASLGY